MKRNKHKPISKHKCCCLESKRRRKEIATKQKRSMKFDAEYLRQDQSCDVIQFVDNRSITGERNQLNKIKFTVTVSRHPLM